MHRQEGLAGLGFLGALIGSISRPLGGWLSDQVGGAEVTLGVFIGAAVTATAIAGVSDRSFPLFIGIAGPSAPSVDS